LLPINQTGDIVVTRQLSSLVVGCQIDILAVISYRCNRGDDSKEPQKNRTRRIIRTRLYWRGVYGGNVTALTTKTPKVI
jgi:hypothetical protein